MPKRIVKKRNTEKTKKNRSQKTLGAHTKKRIRHQKPPAVKRKADPVKLAVGVTLLIFMIAGLIIMLFSMLLINRPDSDIEVSSDPLSTESTEVINEETPMKSYRYELSQEEINKLKELGITDEQIASTNPDEFLADLYSREAYINQTFMIRYPSPNVDVDEPSEDMRNEIIEEMKSFYSAKDYYGVIKTFNEYLMEYTFEAWQDAEITGMYHDALAMVPTAPENEDDDPEPVTKEDVIKAVQNRYSAWAVAYDAFNLNAEMVKDQTLDNHSCMIVSPLQDIKLTGVFDPRLGEIELSGASFAADVIYEFEFKDINSQTGKVYVQSVGIKKQLVGVYYDGNGCTFIENW